MLSAVAPPKRPLADAFAGATSSGITQRNGNSLLIRKLNLIPEQRALSSDLGKTSLPVCKIKGAEAKVSKTPKQDPSHINRIARGVRTVLASPEGARIDAGESFESLYILTEQVVLLSIENAEALYDRVKLEIERGIGNVASSLRASSSTTSSEISLAWLQRLNDAWNNWTEKCCTIKSILTFLDQGYLLEQPESTSLRELGLELFSYRIILDEQIQAQLNTCINVCVHSSRYNSRSADAYKSLHIPLITMLKTLGHYSMMESTLGQNNADFFSDESSKKIVSLNTVQYLEYAEESLLREKEMSEWLYDDEEGQRRSAVQLQDILIKSHSSALINGLPVLLESASIKSLSQLYRLLGKVAELTPLRNAFGEIIISKGATIVQDKEKDDVMIDRLLEYKGIIDEMVKQAFLNDSDFKQTQKESFETFINKRENKPAELVAKFLDARLRSGNKTMTDQEMEHVLNEALILFRYTHAKDMFEEFYTRLFAKRLLLNRSASSDAEQSMLLKLKEECGPSFTQKLETMLTDISLSDEMMKGYSSIQAKATSEGKGDGFELSVNVLTQAHWPSYPQVNVIIPADMAKATERFQDFYESRNQGRKLQWTHSLGTTSLTANLSKAGEKELLVSTFQTVILLLFNNLKDGSKLNYLQIKEQVGLEDKELKRTLQSLACGQIPTRILRKEPQGKEVNEDDEFYVNEGIKNERKRIRINMIQINETQEEQKSTVERVMFDRELILQASAVRILKARKTIKHAELLQEIVKSIASRFTVDIAEIKKTFEILIEKEYMERMEGQRGVYRYLA